MQSFPNLSLLLGDEITAELLSQFKLSDLSNIPSSNLYRNETIKKHRLFSEYDSKVARQISKLLCNKLTLCARIDLQKEYTDASFAKTCQEQIEKRIDKLLEPPPLTKDKPLVIHTEIKKRRGGKRKTKFNQTEFQKLKNRVAFNVPQHEDVILDDVDDIGMLKPNAKPLPLDKKSKLLTKSVKDRIDRISKNETHGLPSLSDSKVEGVELKNPEIKEKEKKSQWFKN